MNDYRPLMQHQGPATNCHLHGRDLGWLSCTSYAAAMGVDQATRGKQKPSGCEIRDGTGDYIGGLRLGQVQTVVADMGIPTELRVGGNVCTPQYAARRLTIGRGLILQGNASAMLSTKFRSTDGPVNHAVWVSAVTGGDSDTPASAYVYDPAADGRRAGIASGPQWWPWSLVRSFAAALHLEAPGEPVRLLGPNWFYALIYPPTPAPPVVESWTMHIAQGATVRVYALSGDCIASWQDTTWDHTASKAPCLAPVHRKTCDRQSGAITVRVTKGAFAGKTVQVNKGVTVSRD